MFLRQNAESSVSSRKVAPFHCSWATGAIPGDSYGCGVVGGFVWGVGDVHDRSLLSIA